MITRLKLSTVTQGLPKYRSMLAGNDAFIPSSFESIASATGTGSSGTITFSSIPGTYQHLQIRAMIRGTASATRQDGIIRFNGTTSGDAYFHSVQGYGTAVSTGAYTEQRFADDMVIAATSTADTYSCFVIDIHDYASTTKNKVTRSFGGYDANGSGYMGLVSNLWISTAAITSITVSVPTGNFATGSVVSLYGIKGA